MRVCLGEPTDARTRPRHRGDGDGRKPLTRGAPELLPTRSSWRSNTGNRQKIPLEAERSERIGPCVYRAYTVRMHIPAPHAHAPCTRNTHASLAARLCAPRRLCARLIIFFKSLRLRLRELTISRVCRSGAGAGCARVAKPPLAWCESVKSVISHCPEISS